MLKKFITLSLTILTLVLAYSCKDDDDPVNPPEKGVPKFVFPVGSYWILNHYDLDDNSARLIDTKYTDSMAVTGTKLLFGRTATIFTSYTDGATKEEYYAVDSNRLYVTSNVIDPGLDIELPLNIPADTWFLIADYDQTEWSLFSQEIKDFEVKVSVITAILNGTFAIKCKRVPNQSVNWGGDESKSITATNFQLIYSFNGTANLGFGPVNFTINIVNNLYHNPAAGIVKIKRDTQKIKISSFDVQTVYGLETVLLDYKFNK